MSGIVSLALIGWMLASNHCGLSGLYFAKSEQAAHSCCHDESAPAPVHMTMCCDSLSAPLPTVAVAPDVALGELFSAYFAVLEILPQVELAPVILDSTGPPGSPYFLSVVLKRSMPSLAPPVVVA